MLELTDDMFPCLSLRPRGNGVCRLLFQLSLNESLHFFISLNMIKKLKKFRRNVLSPN